ncbi:aspartate kinase [Flavobacterium sp. xlx-214]|uniref:aspartate kinase n=1 Tax=unclassified Flavobacterium TaxID=196869 RepID=UPI0013D354E7|nr:MULTISPECIES: aspartate kinase [unclassified Flavobacterium]MBA5793593.1 aspartate kinase [Flavobacterium sp. xlx-221]QMI84523.1 aspartate kinase [Flavobacterium sp. xlx-214]
MKVFKFGGASIKDPQAIRNVFNVLQTVGYNNSLIIASAMGKTTNALEDVVNAYFKKPEELKNAIQIIKNYHLDITNDLFENKNHLVFDKINVLFGEMEFFLSINKSPNYNFVYDQIVSYGEILSTTILSYFFNDQSIENVWIDARNLIKTDTTYRDGMVDWQATEQNIKNQLQGQKLYITQGFIGSDPNHFSVTLGREGSDYSAAIFAYCLDAESVTIWKDVPGVLNADPRYFEDTVLLNHISYHEAIELAFYGASVIHPKTLQPLQRKEIPLYVKSFVNPTLPGTAVSKGVDLDPATSCFIVKKNQLLVSISSKDFSFIMEHQVSDIFKTFAEQHIKVNVIQNSAISFTVCVEDKFGNFETILNDLSNNFNVTYNEDVSLYTIRHFTDEAAQKVLTNQTVLLKQINRETMQIVTKE